MSHLLPSNEALRIAALQELALLDTPKEPVFDRVTRLVTVLLGVPQSTVTLVDSDRQWFKCLEQQIERRTRELNLVIESAYDAYLSIDDRGRILDWNHAAHTMFGWSRKEALTRPITDLMFPAGVPRDDDASPIEWEARRRDGGRLLVEIRHKRYELNGRLRRSLFIHDITERQQLARLRDREARQDALTELPNRRALDERLPEAMARARRSLIPLAVLFLDLDGFKRINDLYGHAMGDELLRDIANRLKTAVRETDFVARWAGDEFVLVLENIENDAIAPLAQKLIQLIEVPLSIGDTVLKVSTSIGIAEYVPGAEETPQELLKRADVAMYEAKRAGKAQTRLASPALPSPDAS